MSGPAPCVLVIHTGEWNNGTPRKFIEFNWRLARRGFAVTAIENRLAPRWRWPAHRNDLLDAMHFLKTNAPPLGLDPQRFVLLGCSAGGQIAQAVASGAPEPHSRGVIAFYAPANMNFAFRYACSDDVLNSLKLLKDYLGGMPNERPAEYHTASGIGL
jgi:acetyl esterase/lipase